MIAPKQLPIYDAASKEVEKAASILERINVAGLNAEERDELQDVIMRAHRLRHALFSLAYDRFLHDRGFRPE